MGKGKGLVFGVENMHGNAFLSHHTPEVGHVIFFRFAEFYMDVNDCFGFIQVAERLEFFETFINVIMDRGIESPLEVPLRESIDGAHPVAYHAPGGTWNR